MSKYRSYTFPSQKLYLSFPVAEASNMIQQINKDLKKKSQAGAVTTAFS